MRLPVAGVVHRTGGDVQRALGEQLAVRAVDQLLLRRSHRHTCHQPLLRLQRQALQAGKGALVVNAALLKREGFTLYRAAIFKRAAAERDVAFAEDLPTVIQRLGREGRIVLAH